MSLFGWTQRKIFWRMLETEQFWGTIDFHNICFPTMEVNGAPEQPGYKLSSKYLPLCSAEQTHSYRSGNTWGWVNDDRIFIFGWTIPLITHYFILILIELDPGLFWKKVVAVVIWLLHYCIWLTDISVVFYFVNISAYSLICTFSWTTLFKVKDCRQRLRILFQILLHQSATYIVYKRKNLEHFV